MKLKNNMPDESNLKLVLLHLLPGLLLLIFKVILKPVVDALGFPPIFVSYLDIVFVLIPFELGYILIRAKKIDGSISLKGIIFNKQKTPAWQFFIFVPALMLWAGMIYTLISGPVDGYLLKNLFSFIPKWFSVVIDDPHKYSQAALMITWISGILLNGIAAPIVEELYFRGYLLPRMYKFGVWGPFLNVVLFSLYHFSSPWQNIERIIALLPMGYAVWWKKNVYISIFTHCTVNIVTTVLLYNVLF